MAFGTTYRDRLVLLALTFAWALSIFFLVARPHKTVTIALLSAVSILSCAFMSFLIWARHRSSLKLESERAHSDSLSCELNAQIIRMQRLLETGEHLSGSLNINVICDRILKDAITLVDADCGALYLFDSRGSIFIQKYEGTKRGVLYQYQHALKNLVRDQLNSANSPFALSYEEIDERGLNEAFSALPLGSLIGVPIIHNEVLKAVLVLVRFSDKRDFAIDELRLSYSLSNHSSLALVNADLYEKSQRRLKEVSLLLKITTGEYTERLPDSVIERASHLLSELMSFKDTILLERANIPFGFRPRQKEDQDVEDDEAELIMLSSEEVLEIESEPQRLATDQSYVDRFAHLLPASADYKSVIFPIIIDGNLSGFCLGNTEESSTVSWESWLSTYLTATQALSLLQHTRSFIQSSQLAMLGEITASIAHSVRTPLTTLSSFTQMLVEKHEDPEFRETFTNVLKEEIDRLNTLTTDILSFTGSPRLQFQENNLNRLCDRILILLRKDLSNSRIRVERNFAENLPPVICDANRIREMMLNIIVNAIHAVENGGTLTVTTHFMRDQHMARITVRDTGSGIPKALQPKIFDPFFTTKTEGTGIGLMIAKRIVDQHGGRIDFSSKEGEGTCFFIDIPEFPKKEGKFRFPEIELPFGGEENRTGM